MPEEFEKDFFDIIKLIKFRKVRNKSQEELSRDISEIRKSGNQYVFVDKAKNKDEMKSETIKYLILENIAKTYQKLPKKLQIAINLEAKNIAKYLKLPNRIGHTAKFEAFIILKDHTENFVNKLICQLFNPRKT